MEALYGEWQPWTVKGSIADQEGLCGNEGEGCCGNGCEWVAVWKGEEELVWQPGKTAMGSQ